jgi:trk system potassium uptake protein TrkA
MRLENLVDIDAMVNQKSVVEGAILDIVRKANIRRLHSFAEGSFELVELSIENDYLKAGSRIADLGLPRGILVAFVIHEGQTIIPTGDTKIQVRDIVGLVLPKEQISRLETLFGA